MNKKHKILAVLLMVVALAVAMVLPMSAETVQDGEVVKMTFTGNGDYYDSINLTPTEGLTVQVVAYDYDGTIVDSYGEYTNCTVTLSEVASILDMAILTGDLDTLHIEAGTGVGGVMLNGTTYGSLAVFITGLTEITGTADGVTIEIISNTPSNTDGIIGVFSSVMAWFVSSIGLIQGIFINNGLTFIGVLAVVGVGIAIGLLVFAIIRKFLELR